MISLILLLVYVAGIIVAWPLVSDWNNSIPVKLAASVLWPLTLVLYGIYWLHKQL